MNSFDLLYCTTVGCSVLIRAKGCWVPCEVDLFAMSAKHLQTTRGFKVARMLGSCHPNFKPGGLEWVVTGWEEYTLLTSPPRLFKIEHKDVPHSW